MKHRIIMSTFFWILTFQLFAQDSISKKERVDFAKTYLEYGASFMPSFKGARVINGESSSITHPASLTQYITWGGFHFWGHTEFYVTIPLSHYSMSKNKEIDYSLLHSVATGARLYPWAVRDKKLRPYLGLSWGALDFKQIIKDEDQSLISKDIMLNYEAGITYNYKKWGVRLGANYFYDNKWNYPISKTHKSKITTPSYSVQVGVLYSFDGSNNREKKPVDEWNSYPKISKLSYDAKKTKDFFIGLGPSSSYSLVRSEYNKSQFPFLKEKLLSKPYFDLSVGYQFNKANLFTAVTFRNPSFETSGFGTKQKIKKTSLTIEVNKYLTDYTGFAPYIGLNVAYDKIKYSEEIDGVKRELSFKGRLEPGLTFGWDIVPGKTSEALILRTNLRLYPFSDFKIDGKKFDFAQLEYNLIQVVFYPDRIKKKKK